MSRSWLVVIAALGGFEGASAHAQAAPKAKAGAAPVDTIAYAWRAQSLLSAPALRSGRSVVLAIVDLNRVCFDYETSTQQQAAASSAAAFIPYLTGAGALQQPAEQPTKPEKLETPTAPPGVAGGFTRATTSDVERAAAAVLKEADAELARIDSAMAAYRSEATAVVAAINVLAEVQRNAGTAHNDFVDKACPGGTGRGPTGLPMLWQGARRAMVGVASRLEKEHPAAAAALARSDTTFERASRAFDRFADRVQSDARYRAWRSKPANERWLREGAAYFEKSDKERKAAGETLSTLRQAPKEINAVVNGLDVAVRPDTIIRLVSLKRDTEQLDVSIKAIGKAEIAKAKGVLLEDKWSRPVTVSHRVFLSAGLLLTTMREHDYQRATVLDATGKGLSTFVDTKGNRAVAFAPVVLSSVTLWDKDAFSVAWSGGVAVRNVRDQSAPEYLMGPSLAVRDQVLLTVSVHFGRVEQLLIGRADSVRKVAVPEAITRAGAVGDRWKPAFAFTLSYRVP